MSASNNTLKKELSSDEKKKCEEELIPQKVTSPEAPPKPPKPSTPVTPEAKPSAVMDSSPEGAEIELPDAHRKPPHST